MCCWGKLQTSLYSIPGPLRNLSLSVALPGRILGVPSPLGPFSSLLNSAPPSIRKQEGRMTPPLTFPSQSRDQNNRAGGDTSQVNILLAAPTPAVWGAESALITL